MKNQAGFSLLEFTFVLAVVLMIGAIVAGAGYYYGDASRNSEFRAHLLSLKKAGSTLAESGGTSGPQNHSAVARAGGVKKNELVARGVLASGHASPGRDDALASAGAKALRHPYGGLSNVTLPRLGGAGGLALVTVEVFDLTPGDCVTAVHMGWDVFDQISINSAAPKKDRFGSPAIVTADSFAIETECHSQQRSAVRYAFAP